MRKHIIFWMSILCDMALGQHRSTFMTKYKDAIQKYIMIGHEEGWKNCDILSANPTDDDVPQISLKLEEIRRLNINLAFEKTNCLLVNYHVRSTASLLALLEFGWKVINHVRLAFLIKLNSSITLGMATNTSNLPFLVAAELEDDTEQFLCPVVGQSKPRLEDKMCHVSYMDYKYKSLRMSLMGMPPDFVFIKATKTIDGANMRLIRMIAQRLKFQPKINMATSFSAAVKQVKNIIKHLK